MQSGGVKGSDKNFISKFTSYIQPGAMVGLFTREGEYMGKVKSNASNEEVADALQKQIDSQVDAAFNIFRTRIDQFGVVAPNIQKLQDKNGQILLELPGVKEPERVTELLKSSANLEFFEVYNYNEIANDLSAFAQAWAQQDTINHTNIIEASRWSAACLNSPVIGMVTPRNKAVVDSILSSPLAKQKAPQRFLCRMEREVGGFPVYDAQGNVVKKANGEDRTTPYWEPWLSRVRLPFRAMS